MIRNAKGRVQEIVLTPLMPGDVGHLVVDALHCDRAIAQPLVQLVHEKPGGNPFFTIQFLMVLAEEALLNLTMAQLTKSQGRRDGAFSIHV